jgi:hypothetical protein
MSMTVNIVPRNHVRKSLDVKKEIRGQIVGALANASFPIGSPEDLLAAFPNGADTTCQAGDVKMTAGEAGKLLKASDFPSRAQSKWPTRSWAGSISRLLLPLPSLFFFFIQARWSRTSAIFSPASPEPYLLLIDPVGLKCSYCRPIFHIGPY